MSIPAIPKDYYGHKTELFLDNLCNQESDNLRDHKHSRLMLFSCLSVKIGSMSCPPGFYHYQKYTMIPAVFLWKTAFPDIGNMQEDVVFFMIFTGLTAPLSYAYRMIFGWCSSNAPLGFKDSPSHSQWISFRVTWRSSSGVSGQWKALRSSRFIRIQNPDPSHWRIFIEVRRRLQNANMQREYGSR